MDETKNLQDQSAHNSNLGVSSRRVFLGGMGAAAAASLFPRFAAAQGGGPRRIDVHHHFTPPAYLEYTRMYQGNGGRGGGGRGAEQARPTPPALGGRGGSAYPGWILQEDLDDMDKFGTATAILSLTTPGLWFGPQGPQRKVIRESNEFAAKLGTDHKGRFGSFASIYPPDTDGALKEIAYAYDTLKCDGIALYTDYRDKWLATRPSIRCTKS
jgi:6-methylsalicylate decarboxylase